MEFQQFIILFKINDPVSDMKTLNIIYHCEKEKDEEDEIV
jgi:hypothetical protein